MENVMELRRSNLVLPTSGYELSREEMSYVEGGAEIYLSNAFLWTSIAATGHAISTVAQTYGGILSFLSMVWGQASAIISGWNPAVLAILALVGFAVVTTVASALSQGKGIALGIDIKWVWFVPVPTPYVKIR